MNRAILPTLCAVLLSSALPARAEIAQADRDRLVLIYKISISQEVCGFELGDQQASALGAASDKLEGELESSEEDAQKLYDATSAALEAGKAKGVCDPGGEWAGAYKLGLEALAK